MCTLDNRTSGLGLESAASSVRRSRTDGMTLHDGEVMIGISVGISP